MHHHHARALRIARRNYLFCHGVVARKHEAYLVARHSYVTCSYESPSRFSFVKNAKEALESALEELQNQLSVLMTVERLLEKA
jgi:hypothetical protein